MNTLFILKKKHIAILFYLYIYIYIYTHRKRIVYKWIVPTLWTRGWAPLILFWNNLMKSMQKGDVFGLVVSEAESHVLLGALAFGECGCPGRLCVLGCQRLCFGDCRAVLRKGETLTFFPRDFKENA